MKKVWAVAVAAAMVAGSVAMAAPAGAAEASCLGYLLGDELRIELETVSIDRNTLEIRINPSGVDDDAGMLLNEVTQAVEALLCLEGGVVTGPVNCLVAKILEVVGSIDPTNLNFRYVYHDPATGEIVIAGGLLLADVAPCLDLTGTDTV